MVGWKKMITLQIYNTREVVFHGLVVSRDPKIEFPVRIVLGERLLSEIPERTGHSFCSSGGNYPTLTCADYCGPVREIRKFSLSNSCHSLSCHWTLASDSVEKARRLRQIFLFSSFLPVFFLHRHQVNRNETKHQRTATDNLSQVSVRHLQL